MMCFKQILVKNISRLCHAKPTVTVNGRFSGPTIYAREGDRVIVNVTNHMSIHWYHFHFKPYIWWEFEIKIKLILNLLFIDDVYRYICNGAILIAPGQTTNVLVRANWLAGRYFMAARPFMDAPLPVENKTATAILQYKGIPNIVLPTRPQLPASNDTDFTLSYNKKLRSLNSAKFPAIMPLKVDRKLFYTVSFGKDLIDFPDKPPKPFNDTGAPLTADLGTAHGTRLSKFAFNSTVELALQDTNLLKVESHPFHLHGCNFFVIRTGIGNFDPVKDPSKFNLVDPIERNTVGILLGVGPPFGLEQTIHLGVWLMHCHLELDTGWGLKWHL
ncbi:hypothetical protein Gohar_013320 [Gossypium harknessii]|uniref:Plastocyanin-like domain-containing protein n=1 Tax=Gossypium harknessii TaxID=34285 RepID=A0A7J9GZN2_9ROSI|nr:hypothetical protein [Gossypium harknessii]